MSAYPDGRARRGIPYGLTEQSRQQAVSDTSAELRGAVADLAGRTRLIVQPVDGNIVVKRGAAGTTANGMLLISGTVYEFDYAAGEDLFGIRVGGANVATFVQELKDK